MSSPDLAPAIYAAVIGNTAIAAALATYAGDPAAFTTSPAPADATYPMIITPNDVTRTDQDFINDPLPVIVRDISVFGQVDRDASKDQTRAVEALALQVRDLFHRKRQSLSVTGWRVLDIVCRGPFPGQADDDAAVHRVVTLTVRLSQ